MIALGMRGVAGEGNPEPLVVDRNALLKSSRLYLFLKCESGPVWLRLRTTHS